MSNTALDYNKLETQHNIDLRNTFQSQLKKRNYSGGNNFRHAILGYVQDEQYQLAKQEMQAYVDSKTDYPVYASKTERFLKHASDLISAIEAKRGFHGMSALSFAKQQELFDRVMEHFDELADIMKKMEAIERDLRVEDMRATVWVVGTFAICWFVVTVVAIGLDFNTKVFHDLIVIIDGFGLYLKNVIFSVIGKF